MKRFYAFTYKIGITNILLGCFFIGIIVGTIVANVFRDFYINEFFLFDESYYEALATAQMNPFVIFQMAVLDHAKEFLLLCVLATTMFGVPVFMIHSSYKGFCLGFLISTVTMRFGIQGILFLLGYLFPHFLILIPVYIITYLKGYELNYKLYSKNDFSRVRMSSYLSYVVILLALVVVASFLEGYVNAGIITNIMLNLAG